MDTHPRRRPTPAFLIMVAAMLGVICAMVSSALEPTTYRATATALVTSRTVTAVPDLRSSAVFAAQVSDSSASLATAPVVLDDVVRRLGLPGTARALAQRIHVERRPDTALLDVAVTDADPARAAAVANAVVQGLARVVPTLQPQASGTAPVTGVEVVQPARAPQSPSGLALPLVVLIGLGTGGGIAGAVLLAARAVRRRPPPGAGIGAPSLL